MNKANTGSFRGELVNKNKATATISRYGPIKPTHNQQQVQSSAFTVQPLES